jgi:hypothetical protein
MTTVTQSPHVLLKGTTMTVAKKIKPMTIHQRIHAVMCGLKYIQKGDKRVNNQYTFVSHDAVTAAVRPHLIEHGIVVIPSVQAWGQDGNRITVTMNISFINIDDPSDKIDIEICGQGIDPQDKGFGKAYSYAKKYAFLSLFCLETGDDPERDLIDHVEGTITSTQCVEIETLIDATKSDLDKFLAWLKVDSVDQIQASRYNMVMAKLKKKGSV